MSLDRELKKRANDHCELCSSDEANIVYAIPASPGSKLEHHIWICNTCQSQLNNPETADEIHWRCLNESIWSEVPAIQVVSWRFLHKIKKWDWARDLLDIAYLEDDTLAWAKASGDDKSDDDSTKHVDCYGAVLSKGDTVVLVKTLDVKGATFNAKMGTVVRNIRLVEDNIEQIEGKVEGSQIVILTKYVRKSNP
ncbi:MAG TPA: PhnA domain-containing protein [Chitinophagaceae bacterium]|mgnify:CR=1 FL=1|nr:PhnA domain-containing protein [Chitinophagaceae bacterium]